MPRTKLLVSALALALASATTAQAQSFSGVVVFGDSLSDDGNVAQLAGLPAGFGFTTNPDSVYADLVAAAFGFDLTNSLAGGSDYAVGGACARANSASFTCVNDPSGPAGVFSLTNQIGGYLAANGGQADAGGLYMLWGGANDIFTYANLAGQGLITGTQAQQLTGLSAQTMVGLAGALQAAGAKTIVVFNLPDLGLTPSNVGTANQAGATGLAFVYNSTFNAALATLGDGIVPINTYGLINEIVANPSLYGFTDVTHAACGVGSSSVACGPTGSPLPYHWAPGTDQTFLFADGVHPSGAAHQMLANVVVATLSAPGQVSMAGEVPLQVYADHAAVINNEIFALNGGKGAGESAVYGHLQYSQQKFKAALNTSSMDNKLYTGTIGADLRYSDTFSFGAAVTVGSSNGVNGGASIGGTEVLFSGYGVAHFGMGFLSAILTGGSNSLDIDRSIVLGPTTRVESGSTNASHTAAELGGGLDFGGDDLHHGPFASWTWQKVGVDGYMEDGLDSTAMYFNDFDRESSVGRIGYQVQGTAGSWQPYGRVAYAADSDDNVTAVQAGSNTMNGHFTLDGFQAPGDWWEADVGIAYEYNDTTAFSFSYRGRFSDDTQDVNSVDFGVRMTF